MGEVAKYRNGKAHENCIDESGKYIVVNSKFVSTNGTVIKHSNMQNEPLAQNEIAFVLSDVPNGRAIARTFLVEENDKYTLNQRIAGITSSENTYPYFLHILMNRHPYFLAFDDGVKQTNLSVSDVLNFETYYPEYEEQKQIGEYFRNLDRLITLHQREFAFLCKEKSKKFRYIKNAWEQRKVSELFKVTRGYVLAATLTEPAKTDEMPYPVYSSQTKDNGLMGYYKDYLYEDAITWTTDGANAGTVNYRAGKFYCTNVCGVLLSNEVTANQMIAEALNNVAKGYVSYVGNPKLMNNVMADIEIMIPTHAEEREKLSVFFRNLDTLITLHQRKPNFYTGGYYAE